jgi:ATP-dependent DNA helicase RecG
VSTAQRTADALAGPAAASPLAERPVSGLRGVGPALAATLERLGIRAVQDLLFHLPLRYEDRTHVVAIGALRPGTRAVVEGEIQLAEVVFRRRRTLLCRIADGSGFLTLRFFHFSSAQQDTLVRGTRLRCFGEVRAGPGGLEIVHPEYRRLLQTDGEAGEATLTPFYPGTEGLQQSRLRGLIGQALRALEREPLPDVLPRERVARLQLPTLGEALRYVHAPPADARLDELLAGRHPAQRRLAFEELLAHQLSLRMLRRAADADASWPLARPVGTSKAAELRASLPFALTGAQERAWTEIERDLARPQPMMRLVQGDVGSGKTVVAALAALRAVDHGAQAAVMAPTELLAEQHARNFAAWLDPLGVRVVLLSGRLGKRARDRALAELGSGEAAVAIGTHALFQEGVEFARLALVIVDEQHRFGVHQRLALREKGADAGRFPHQLVMTATPIPRTLAMTAYADLDVSVIDELPPGRTPIRTVVLNEARRAEVVARIDAACAEGRQAYWVCPLIEESEALPHQAAEETAAALAEALPQRRIGLVHGRMPPAQKDAVMTRFKAGAIDLLVATTVIEVGVDVPNASLMVIENTERMGLAQLHQLRGRVGRGTAESSCVLLFSPPLAPLARERLETLRQTGDGFEVARKDLELRGPGELLGTRQTGLLALRVADLVRDAELLPAVQAVADEMLARSPDSVATLLRRWIGAGERFAKA